VTGVTAVNFFAAASEATEAAVRAYRVLLGQAVDGVLSAAQGRGVAAIENR
jgi:hypothetical protein